MMNEYCSFDLYTKQVLDIHVPTSRIQGKMQTFDQQYNVLHYGTLHRVNFRPIWTWFVKNGTFTMLRH